MLGVDIDFGRRRMVERQWFSDRCFISHFTKGLRGDWITRDRAGPLGGCSPACVGPCEQVLNVLIAYRRYDSGKPSSRLSIVAWLKPTTSLVESGREARWGPTDRSADMLRV
jgi:hypothetical protein